MSVSYVFGSSLSVLVSSVSEHTHVPRRPCFATKMSISLFVSVFSVSLSVWPTDRVVSGWWCPVHRATTMNLYCGITDPARSLTMGNELLRPGADPLPFERRGETDGFVTTPIFKDGFGKNLLPFFLGLLAAATLE